eukprot:scaffold40782_cov191-Amphora_coffeaeformis.AAC.2
MKIYSCSIRWRFVLVAMLTSGLCEGFQPKSVTRSTRQAFPSTNIRHADESQAVFQPMEDTFFVNVKTSAAITTSLASMAAVAGGVVTAAAPAPALAAAGPVPSALMAWLHFLGLLGVSGGLVAERFLIKPGLTLEDEEKLNVADGVYGLSALSLLISGYFRVTEYAKGWDFYKNEPIFWVKMSSVAVLGGLSFFPAIVFFRRDQARKQGKNLAPLSDVLVERLTRIINAELLALVTIPLFASLMARGVLYIEDFPWALGVVLYAASLGGAGFKYGKEAFAMMDEEGALSEVTSSSKSD